MSTNGEEVDAECVNVNRDLTNGLSSIGVNQRAPLLGQFGDGPEWLDGADLVVGELDTNQQRIVGNSLLCSLQIDGAIASDWEDNHIEPLRLQRAARFPDGLVLDCGGHDPTPFGSLVCQPVDHEVVALGRAACEHNLVGGGAD